MRRSDYQSTVMIMISLALVTLTGYVRQAVIAYSLGADRVADIYLVAFAIPEFMIIALPIVFSPVIIPFFLQIRQQQGPAQAWRWGERVSTWMMASLVAVTIVGGLAAPVFIGWLSPGFNPAEREQALRTFYRMLPALPLIGASVLVGSFLQAYRRFNWQILTTAVYNLVFVLALLLLPMPDLLERAGWGVAAGALIALLFQLPLFLRLRQVELGQAAQPGDRPVELAEALGMIGWMAAGYGAHHLILFIDRAMATALGAGSAAVLSYGYHLALAVGQLSGLSVSTAIFPGLSEKVGSQDLDSARSSITNGMALVWALALPASLALVALRIPIVQLLLEHGAFASNATQVVGAVLGVYAFAVLADAMCQPLWRVVYATRSGPATLVINSIQTVIRVSANLLLIPRYGVYGLALSAVIGLSVQVLILAYYSARTIGWRVLPGGWGFAAKVAISGGIAFIITVLSVQWFAMIQPGLPALVVLVIHGILLIGVYGILSVLVFKLFRRVEDAPNGKSLFSFIRIK